MNDLFINNLVWRHTKESAKDDYVIPDMVEDVHFLDFTDIERANYDDHSGMSTYNFKALF